MKQQLFIPSKLKVGFQHREDTYNGKLAYVIYYDQANKLRKEASWNSWCNKNIESIDYDNQPIDGFVLNKGVGGQRESRGWNARNEYIRVYDPRGFEFEISLPNLLFILQICDCSRGKGLEGKFVYSWDNKELVLLPVVSEEYKNSIGYTHLQNQKLNPKSLIAGATYITKKQVPLVFVGKLDYYAFNGATKRFIFWDDSHFVALKDIKCLGALVSDTMSSNYAELVDNYHKSSRGSKVASLCLEKAEVTDDIYRYRELWYYAKSDNEFVECYSNYGYNSGSGSGRVIQSVDFIATLSVNDGVLTRRNCDQRAYAHDYPMHRSYTYNNHSDHKTVPWVPPTGQVLYAVLENGPKVPVLHSNFG